MPGGQFGIVATLDDYDTELRIIAAYAEIRLKERGEFEDYETDKKRLIRRGLSLLPALSLSWPHFHKGIRYPGYMQ